MQVNITVYDKFKYSKYDHFKGSFEIPQNGKVGLRRIPSKFDIWDENIMLVSLKLVFVKLFYLLILFDILFMEN